MAIMGNRVWEVLVSKSDFKFNCAHFIAFHGFRERLHGHNYTTSVRVVGGAALGRDGYVMDFGDIKKATRALCKELNEYFICPDRSDCIDITETDTQLCLVCEDGATFSFPKGDCARLPISHSSAEEISHYLWFRLVRKIGLESLHSRGVTTIEVSVAEAPLQQALFRSEIPANESELIKMEQSSVFTATTGCL